MKNTAELYQGLEIIKAHLEVEKETELVKEIDDIISFLDKYFDFDWKQINN